MEYKMKRWLLTLVLLLSSLSPLWARERFSLNSDWSFFFGHEVEAERARHITLPHTWNEDALVGSFPYLRTQGVYRRGIYIPSAWEGKRLFLRFGAASTVADLLVNGQYAGSHRGAGVSFTIEITDWVRFGEQNRLMVVVSNVPRNDLMPLSTDRNIYGGLTGGVELLVTDPLAISPLYLGTEGLLVRTNRITEDGVEGEAELHLSLKRPRAVELTLMAHDASGRLLFSQRRNIKNNYNFDRPIQIPFSIEQAPIWSPEKPELCRFTAVVESGEWRDSVTIQTGLRTLQLTERKLLLNGREVALNGVSLSYDHPQEGALYAEQAVREDLSLVEDLGANAVRSPFGPHPASLYTACDERGVLAWIDLPFERSPLLADICYYASPDFEEQGLLLLEEIVAQHINHPSVIFWGLFSDMKAVDGRLIDYIGRLKQRAGELDPTRPTVAVSNQDGPINFITEAIAWHLNLGWERGNAEDTSIWLAQLANRWSHLKSAIYYGFEGFVDQQPEEYSQKVQSGTLELPERRQSRIHEEYVRALSSDTLLWGWWVNGLSDYKSARRAERMNGSGLVAWNRAEKKDAYYLYRAVWNRKSPTLHLADKRRRERRMEPQHFVFYLSEGLSPTVLLNGDTLQLERYAPCIYRTEEVIPRIENRLQIVASVPDSLGQDLPFAGVCLEELWEFRCGSALTAPVQQAPLQTIGLPPIN